MNDLRIASGAVGLMGWVSVGAGSNAIMYAARHALGERKGETQSYTYG